MLDGKSVNAITDTNSTQTCNVCKAKPSEMNNLSFIRKKKQLTAKQLPSEYLLCTVGFEHLSESCMFLTSLTLENIMLEHQKKKSL